MKDVKRIVLGVVAWVVTISGLHMWLNVDWPSVMNGYLPKSERKINIAYIPVT